MYTDEAFDLLVQQHHQHPARPLLACTPRDLVSQVADYAAYHGRKPLSQEIWTRLYRNDPIRMKSPQYAWIDTLFALPE